MTLQKINSDINKTKQKIEELKAKLNDLEKQRLKEENLRILQTVRSIVSSPEDLYKVLEKIKSFNIIGSLESPVEIECYNLDNENEIYDCKVKEIKEDLDNEI